MLEKRIEELAEQITQLTDAVTALKNVLIANVDPVSATLNEIQPAKGNPEAKEIVAESAAAKSAKTSATTSVEGAEVNSTEVPVEITYDDHVKPATLKVAQKHGRDKAKAILTSFGVDGAQKLTEEQWPAYVAACEEALK